MEKIICEKTYYYSIGGNKKNTFCISFRLKDTIDGQILQRAAVLALKRFPYYAVHCSSVYS